MAVTEIVPSTASVTIDLDDPPTGHRLAELVQVLTGCSIERAELAVSDPTPAGPTSPGGALDTMARALVELRRRSEAESAPEPAPTPDPMAS
jgi:hypothetical protein